MKKEKVKVEPDFGDGYAKCPKCKKCNDTGSYRIPVSSPIMAPYGLDNTTSVPCECKLRKL